MPDRVSVGSPGGAGGNEIEAVARAGHEAYETKARELGHVSGSPVAWEDVPEPYRSCTLAAYEAAIAALDAARRSPQGDPTVPWQQWNDEVNTRINAQIELHDARAEIKRLLSPQGEGPDGGFDSAAGETHSWLQGEEHEAPPPGKFVSIAANKAMAAPVSGTELDMVRRIVEWLRGDDAERISGEAINDGIPPEDALAHVIEQRFPVSGTEPAKDDGGLCLCASNNWSCPVCDPAKGGTEPDTVSLRAIVAWVREQAEDKDYGTACEWRNVADAIEREGESSDWRCECGDLNRDHEAFCYRCGAGQPESTEPDTAKLVEALRPFVEAYDAVGRTFCPEFNGPEALAYFDRAAEVLAGVSVDAGKAEGSSGYEQIGDINWPPEQGAGPDGR